MAGKQMNMHEKYQKFSILRAEQLAEGYLKEYPEYMQELARSPVGKTKGLNHWDIAAVGMQMDQFREDCMTNYGIDPYTINEDDGSMANLGALPKIGLDLIAALYGTSPLALVAGIQPIDEPSGFVWFKDWEAQNDRGNISDGDVLIRTDGAPDEYQRGYASDTFTSNFYHHVSNGVQTASNIALGGSDDFMAPLDPRRVSIYGSAIFNSGADTAVFPACTPDVETGIFSQSVIVNSTLYTLYGTVDFEAGEVDFQFSADPSGATDLYADFAVLEEVATDIPNSILKMRTKDVRARFMSMKTTWGFEEDYMMKKRWGQDAESVSTNDLTSLLNAEVFNLVLQKIIANIPGTNNVDWGRQPGTGVSLIEYQLTLPIAMIEADKLLNKYAGRGEITAWIGDLDACAVIAAIPGFKKLFDSKTLGPHIYGTFRGTPVIRVPGGSTQIPNNTLIGICKLDNPFEASVVYCPYMPITTTPVFINGVNPLKSQKAVAIWGAIDSMIPKFSAKITIDQSGFDFGAN
jgi:hypothetical protein